MSDGEEHSFQMTPLGIMPLSVNVPANAVGEVAPAVAKTAEPRERIEPTYGKPAPRAPGPLTGKEILALASARVKAINELLKTVPALERERAELQRLIVAAKPARRIRKGVQ